MEAAGCDNGADVGVDLGPPVRAKAVGHFPEDHRHARKRASSRPQRLLGDVVGRLDVAARHEDQQLGPRRDRDRGLEVAAVDLLGPQRQEAVEFAPQLALVGLDGGVGQARAPAADSAGPLQKALEGRREDGVAGIDGVLRIADQMGEADLVRRGMPALGREPIGDPHLWPGIAEELDGHDPAACRRDRVIDRRRRSEHPLPVRLAADAGRGLVAGDHGRRAHGLGDDGCLGAERLG